MHAVGRARRAALRRRARTGCGDAAGARRASDSRRPRRSAALDELRAQDEDARRKAMERVKANDLVMKVSDAEWQWDRQEAHVLLHRREARRLPHARARARVDVPHAHRAEADRRARRGEAARRHRPLRTPVLFRVLAARAAAGEPRRREGPAPVAQSVADLRRVRATDVLPAVRARVLRAEPEAFPEGRESSCARRAARRRSWRTTSSASA